MGDFHPILYDKENNVIICNVCRLGSLEATQEPYQNDLNEKETIYCILKDEQAILEHLIEFHKIPMRPKQIKGFLERLERAKTT